MEEIESLLARAAGQADPAERLAAFGEIVRRFQDMAYGCAYAVLGDFHLAEDAAQEAFLAAWRELPGLRRPEAFPGWLRRILLSRCSRMTRGRRVSTTRLDQAAAVASSRPAPPDAAERREMRQRVLAAVAALPEAQRMTTTLFYIDGYSQKEIAEFLEVPVTTVKKRLAASRNRLKERLLSMVDETLKSFPLPGDFADMVVRMVASEQDVERVAELLPHAGPFESVADAQSKEMFVVEEAGQVESAGDLGLTTWSIGSTIVKAVRGMAGAAGEQDGVPDPRFVKGCRGQFKLARQRGVNLALVHGTQYDHAFCGYVPCFYYPVARLPCRTAREIVTRATIRQAAPEQEQAARQAYLLDPHAPKIAGYVGLGGGVQHAVEQDGRAVGFVRVHPDYAPAAHYDIPFGHVTDITVRTREAALAVIRLAGRLAAEAGAEDLCLMQSHMTLIGRTMLSLGGTYVLRGPCDLPGLDAEMVAVIDLPGLTNELAGEFQSRLRASPAAGADAALSIQMGKATVGFVAKGGRLEVVAARQQVHCPLPRWVVTRLYVGFYGGADVLAMGPIPADRSDGKTPDDPELDNRPLELPEPQADLFAALFPALWPTALPDPDVWPWVIGQEHSQYRSECTAAMRDQIDALQFPWLGR